MKILNGETYQCDYCSEVFLTKEECENHEREIHLCGVCGKELDSTFHIKHNFDYGSKYDGEILNLRACVKCLDKLITGVVKEAKGKIFDENKNLFFYQ